MNEPQMDFTVNEIEGIPLETLAGYIHGDISLPSEDREPGSEYMLTKLNSDPGNEMWAFLYAVVLLREGQHQQALPYFEMKYELEAHQILSRYYRGHCMLLAGDYRSAAEDFVAQSEMYRSKSDHDIILVSAWFSRGGMIFRSLGEMDQAIVAFEEALKTYPDAFDPAYFLGIHHAQKGDYEHARKLLLIAYEYAPPFDSHYIPYEYAVRYALGVLAYRQGDLQEATAYWNEALSVHPSGEDAAAALRLTSGTSV